MPKPPLDAVLETCYSTELCQKRDVVRSCQEASAKKIFVLRKEGRREGSRTGWSTDARFSAKALSVPRSGVFPAVRVVFDQACTPREECDVVSMLGQTKNQLRRRKGES